MIFVYEIYCLISNPKTKEFASLFCVYVYKQVQKSWDFRGLILLYSFISSSVPQLKTKDFF